MHSFRTLLANLATWVKNVVCPRNKSDATFNVLTTPTPIQRRAFKLLGVSPSA